MIKVDLAELGLKLILKQFIHGLIAQFNDLFN